MESVIIGSLAISVILALIVLSISGLFLMASIRERVYVKAERERMLDQVRIARGGRR
jgi:hypothetical protein